MWDMWEYQDGPSVFKTFTSASEDNYFGYSSGQLDNTVAAAQAAPDWDEYHLQLLTAQSILATEAPVLFLWDLRRIAIWNRRLKNFDIPAYNVFDFIEDAYLAN